ncbi:MAG: alpha/beta hydrolase family protein [Dermatophilaceae bacterium]
MEPVTEPVTLFTAPDFQAAARSAIGRAGIGAPDVGLVLRTLAKVSDGDAQSWYAAWTRTAEALASEATASRSAGHLATAGWFFLAASDAYSRSAFFVDGMPDDSVLLPAFRRSRQCWDEFVASSQGRHLPVAVAYEGGSMPGYLFRPDATGLARATLVVTNGSDGSLAALWNVAKVALDRGWNAFLFDGPGQQSMLFERGVPFRHDWEAVLTPVVDGLCERDDVQDSALLAYGVSQGGYWLPRALAFEHRFLAAVVDGGVWDVSRTWFEKLPERLREVYADGDAQLFDQYLAMGASDAAAQREFVFRAKPYGQQSPFALFSEVARYHLRDVVSQVTTPVMVVDPDDEAFFPGQPQQLFDALPGPKTMARFTRDEGANHHCQPLARNVFGLRMADFFESYLSAPRERMP